MREQQGFTSSWSAKAVTWWATVYTHSVLPETAAARREELKSDLHEQFSDGARTGLSLAAISRSVVWRALRGIPADLRWGAAHYNRKRNAMGTTSGNRETRNLFHGVNILWAVLAAAFVVGFGATLAEHLVQGYVLPLVMFGNFGFPTSALLVLTSMVVFPVARAAQLISQKFAQKPTPHGEKD